MVSLLLLLNALAVKKGIERSHRVENRINIYPGTCNLISLSFSRGCWNKIDAVVLGVLNSR